MICHLATAAILVLAFESSALGQEKCGSENSQQPIRVPEYRIGDRWIGNEDVTRVTQEITHVIEEMIRRVPTQWHNFQPTWPSDLD